MQNGLLRLLLEWLSMWNFPFLLRLEMLGSATSPSLMFHFCTPQGEFVRSAENLLTTVGSLTTGKHSTKLLVFISLQAQRQFDSSLVV